MGLDLPLDVLLVLTGGLQLGALVALAGRRKRSALAMAGTNAVLAFAISIMDFGQFLRGPDRREHGPAVLFALALAAVLAAAMGLAKRRESGWLFWPVWFWNLLMIHLLIKLRFFFHVYF